MLWGSFNKHKYLASWTILFALFMVSSPVAGLDQGQISVASSSESEVPYRGSAFVFRNTISGYSLDPGAQLSYNPYYAMTFSFQPSWWFDDHINLRANLDVVREITNSDVTTDRAEALLGDLALIVGYSKFYTIPMVEIDLSADLVIRAPSSKVSQAHTMILGVGPGIQISKTFDLLKGLNLGYSLRANPFFHRYSTAENESPSIPCAASSRGCDPYINTGLRNPFFRLQQSFNLSVGILDWLSVSVSYGILIDWLYSINKDNDQYETVLLNEPQDRRFFSVFEAQVTFTPMPAFQVGLGLSTFNSQLRPDSQIYNPLFNRYSMIFVDMRLSFDGLISQITSD
jgi:hypothetical protein